MEKLIVSKHGTSIVPLSESEIEQISIAELEQHLQPQQSEIEDAEFELKLITKLTEWGII